LFREAHQDLIGTVVPEMQDGVAGVRQPLVLAAISPAVSAAQATGVAVMAPPSFAVQLLPPRAKMHASAANCA
jgi:hypothetical protein